MGRRKGIPVAWAAVICGLAVPLAARAQAPPLPARCQAPSKAVKPPALELFIDQLQLTGADLPAEESQDQFVAMLEQSAGSGASGWVNRVWDAARTAWQNRGYFQAVVDVETLTDRVEDGVRHVGLRIRVDPGPLYRIEEVKVLDVNPGGKLAFSMQRLRDLIPLRPGEAVDVGRAKAGVEAIRALYASHGYIDLQATPSFQIQDGQYRITLYVMLDQGEQYRVGKIDVLGFSKTGLSLLKKKIKTGDVFNWNVVKDFYTGNQWLMPAGATVADDRVDRDAKTHTVNLLLDFRACPQPQAIGRPEWTFPTARKPMKRSPLKGANRRIPFTSSAAARTERRSALRRCRSPRRPMDSRTLPQRTAFRLRHRSLRHRQSLHRY